MKLGDIPVLAVGPGTQPADEDGQALSYIDMPSEMATFRAPRIPEPESVAHLAGAREAMGWLRRALAGYGTAAAPLIADLSALDAQNRELVNQIVGEGEVSISYNGAWRARTQESVLAGVWRTLYLSEDGAATRDFLEVADAPHVVRLTVGRDRTLDLNGLRIPAEIVNAAPILAEIESRLSTYQRDGQGHVINLTLLPLSEADLAFLEERLGRGPVDMLSRAYGKCQVTSTEVRDVWWVRYYNTMGTLILNTLEIVDVPAVASAAPEDLRDSCQRLEEILAPYWSDVT